MFKGFWGKLKKPFLCLAPMSGVTTSAFRQVVAEINQEWRKLKKEEINNERNLINAPIVFWTEFISATGLNSAGQEKLLPLLKFTPQERPIVAQIFGACPDDFYQSAKIVAQLNFDGVDINLGCPDRAVVKQGAGAELIGQNSLVKEIILATKEGAPNLPISVKTRIGRTKNEIADWLPFLVENDLAVITIHGRTKNQGYAGTADWSVIKEAVDIANSYPEEKRPLIIGNGDISNLNEAEEKIKFSGVAGAMIGRSAFSNPWFFTGRDSKDIPIEERKIALLKHLAIAKNDSWPTEKFCELKKYFKSYLTNFPDAKELRMKLMAIDSMEEAEKILKM